MSEHFNHRKHTKSYLNGKRNIYKILFWVLLIIIIACLLIVISGNTSIKTFFEKIKQTLSSKTQQISSGQFCIDNEFNTIMCKSTCGMNSLNYQTYKCVKGEAICYCKE